MILPYEPLWSVYLNNIDIKSSEWPWGDDYWKDEIKRNIVRMWMGGEDNEKLPLGFVAYRFSNVKDLGVEGEGSIIHILKLAVYPKHRCQGIGTKLLEVAAIAAKLQMVKTLVTFLHEEDKSGRDWLIKRGFTARTVHGDMYPDGRDGYSFIKELQ